MPPRMTTPIDLHYHAGFLPRRNPLAAARNILRFGTVHHPTYNFGDQISPAIVSHLSGRPAIYAQARMRGKLIAVGSVIGAAMPGDTIWGTGLMKAEHAAFVRQKGPSTILAVRGPETRRVLLDYGVACPEVYGDPGMLLPLVYRPPRQIRHRVGVVPHHSHLAALSEILEGTGVHIISPRMPWTNVVSELCACATVLSSSLHGVIIAEAYGIPTVAMKHGDWLHGSPLKFADYFKSTGRDATFLDSTHARDVDEIERLAAAGPRPQFELMPLLRAFPYLRNRERLEAELSAHFDSIQPR